MPGFVTLKLDPVTNKSVLLKAITLAAAVELYMDKESPNLAFAF